MVSVCFYFQVHQPRRVKRYRIFDIGRDRKYFNDNSESKLNNKKLINLHSKYCIRRIFKVPSGQKYWLCPGCATFKQHGESSAVHDALKKHNDTQGADLYLYGHWWCCQPCWDAMIKAGIKNVYLVDNAYELFARK